VRGVLVITAIAIKGTGILAAGKAVMVTIIVMMVIQAVAVILEAAMAEEAMEVAVMAAGANEIIE